MNPILQTVFKMQLKVAITTLLNLLPFIACQNGRGPPMGHNTALRKTAIITARNNTRRPAPEAARHPVPSESIIVETAAASHTYPKKSMAYPVEAQSIRHAEDPWVYLDSLPELPITIEFPKGFDTMKGFPAYDREPQYQREAKYPSPSKFPYRKPEPRIYFEPSYGASVDHVTPYQGKVIDSPPVRKIELEEPPRALPHPHRSQAAPSVPFEHRALPSEFGYNLYDSKNVVPYNPVDYKKYPYGYGSKTYIRMLPSHQEGPESVGFFGEQLETRPSSLRESPSSSRSEERYGFKASASHMDSAPQKSRSAPSRYMEPFLPSIRSYGFASFPYELEAPRRHAPPSYFSELFR